MKIKTGRLGRLGRLHLSLALSLVGGISSCRTSDPFPAPPSREDPEDLGGESKSSAGWRAGVSANMVPDDATVPDQIVGFTASGPASCLPLEPGRTCLAVPSALPAACEAVKGEVRRCEDCQSLCTNKIGS